MEKYLIPLLLLLLSCSSSKTDIYEWRGTNRSGVYPDTGLLKAWPPEGPREIWAIDGLGNGFGSPQFTEDHFYITGEVDSMAVLYCFDLDGRMSWKTILGKEWVTSFPGSRSAPTIAGDLVYVGTGMGDLYCVSKGDGSLVWSREFTRDFQGVYPLHGHSEAVVVWKDRVFWTPGGKTHNIVALERFTGELIWSNPGFGEYSAYNPGQLIKLKERTEFVTFSAYHIMGLDAATGEMLWSQEQTSYPQEKRSPGYGDTHANSVIYSDGSIFYVAGDGNCGVRLELSGNGSTITEVWRNQGFDSFMGGVVKLEQYLYTCGTTSQYLKSIDANTGVLKDSIKIGQGAVIAADGMLYYYNQRGEMKLVSYEEGRLSEVSSFRINKGTGHHFSHPVIHRGVLYQRRGESLMAYDITVRQDS
jgi:outer membrane protein assembly factor BamB